LPFLCKHLSVLPFNSYHMFDSNKQATHVDNAKCHVLSSANYREVLLSNIICTVEKQQLFTTSLSSRNRSLGGGVCVDLAASRKWSRRGSRIVVLPRRQLKPDQYVKHDGKRRATDRASSI
jgi:hypothetical protein